MLEHRDLSARLAIITETHLRGPRARPTLQDAEKGRAAIYVSSLVLVEICDAAQRGLIQLEGGSAIWAAGLFSTGSFLTVDLSIEIVLRAEELRAIPERTDRLIAATASFVTAFEHFGGCTARLAYDNLITAVKNFACDKRPCACDKRPFACDKPPFASHAGQWQHVYSVENKSRRLAFILQL